MNGEQGPVAWHDPYNGDTERLAADAAAYRERMTPHATRDRLAVIRRILVEECGADAGYLDMCAFDHHWPDCHEFRFQGALGFGGKVWSSDPPRVSCYPEDATPERMAMIDRANQRLAEVGR